MTDSTVADLSFVTRDQETGCLSLWTPERPDDYAAACAAGRDYGDELIAHIKVTGDVNLFGAVIRAIVRSGDYGAVEIGFCTSFGIMLAGVPFERIAAPTARLAAA